MADKIVVDPVNLSVLWNSLISIADEMGTALRSTAFSEAVREGDDFSTGIFDRRGRLVAQGNFTPGHLGAMPYVLKHVFNYFPAETMKPGDSIALNDSFLGAGHYPDFFIISPVFREETLIGFTVNSAHHVDVGGAAPGSQRVHGVTEAFQEGIRILPVKLAKQGKIDDDLMRVLLGNVRLPDKVRGDLRAQLNANHVGQARIVKLYNTYGEDLVEAVIDAIIAKSEEITRALIADVPNGTYSFEDFLDDAGPGTGPIRVHVAVTVRDDSILVDFSESSDQVGSAMNCYINYTRAYGVFAIKILTGMDVPNNHGSFLPIEVTAREGSFFNAKFPAPSGGRAAVQIRIFDAINGALASVLPKRAMGAFSHWGNPNIGGTDPDTGKPFILYDLMFGGYGGLEERDGEEGLAPVMNCSNIPVEVHELNNPALVERLELIPDSAGAGRTRGGCGLRKDIRILANDAVVTLLGDRHKHEPYGLFGGLNGSKGATILNPDGEARPLDSKEVYKLAFGDVLSFRLAGSGGYGNPRERDRKKVKEDLRDGFISRDVAMSVYGLSESEM